MKPAITVARTSNNKALQDRLRKLGSKAVYVGIPASTAFDRQKQLKTMISGMLDQSKTNKSGKPGKSRQRRIDRATKGILSGVSNAQLLYIHSKGSPARRIPARPVLEPAIVAPGNKEAIAHELSLAVQAQLDGKPGEMKKRLRRAGLAGQNAAKGWFLDSRNGWAPNAPATIKAKGSDKPLIDTGALRQAITYVVKDS